MHRTFKDIGIELSKGWGIEDCGNLTEVILKMPNESRMVCLLVAILDELRDIRSDMAEPPQEPVADDPSDGMIRAIKIMTGDRELQPWPAGLSIRARRALRKANVTYMSEITPERLSGINGCGEITINELMKFKNGDT